MKNYSAKIHMGIIPLFTCIVITLLCQAHALGVEAVLVKRPDGTPSLLQQKVVTIKENNVIRTAPSRDSEVKFDVDAMNVFIQLKTDQGQSEENGYYRIALSAQQGLKSIGWIDKDNVRIWATRFLIEPLKVNENTTFRVTTENGSVFAYDADEGNNDIQRALVLETKEEDPDSPGPFTTAFCRVRLGDAGGTKARTRNLRNTKLEVVFVLENADYLSRDYTDNGKLFYEYLADLGEQFVKTAQQQGRGIVPVRFGLIAFADNCTDVQHHPKPTVVHKLSESNERWLDKLKSIQGQNFINDKGKRQNAAGDFESDGLSALWLAVNDKLNGKVGWTDNSSKHIVYLGNGSFHKYGEYQEREGGLVLPNHAIAFAYRRSPDNIIFKDPRKPDFDPERNMAWHEYFGYTTTGKQIEDIQRAAIKTYANKEEEVRGNRYVHMIHVGQTIEQILGGTGVIEGAKAVNKKLAKIMAGKSDQQRKDIMSEANRQKPGILSFAVASYRLEEIPILDKEAIGDFETIAKTPGNEGYSTHMNPDNKDVLRVTNELGEKMNASIEIMLDVATGNEKDALGKQETNSNEISRPIFKLISGSVNENKELRDPVRVGEAYIRDENTGRVVGKKNVLVGRTELNRLQSAMRSVLATLDEKDNEAIFAQIKRALAKVASGQKDIPDDVPIQELITDLPLNTAALRKTAVEISQADSEDIADLKRDITLAITQVDKLLNDESRFKEINSVNADSGARNAKETFAFLELRELP